MGPDLLRIEGGVLAIYSRRNMSDWTVREFYQPAIWFQDQKFFLSAKQSLARPRRWRYALSPWPEDRPQSSSGSIFYTEDYVHARERACRSALACTTVRCLLLPFWWRSWPPGN